MDETWQNNLLQTCFSTCNYFSCLYIQNKRSSTEKQLKSKIHAGGRCMAPRRSTLRLYLLGHDVSYCQDSNLRTKLSRSIPIKRPTRCPAADYILSMLFPTLQELSEINNSVWRTKQTLPLLYPAVSIVTTHKPGTDIEKYVDLQILRISETTQLHF